MKNSLKPKVTLKLFILAFAVFQSGAALAQDLTLYDLQKICSSVNWQEVNVFLNSKGWEYHESSEADNYHYATITWSYRKSFNNKASGWFYLFTHDDEIGKVIYSTFNQNSYAKVSDYIIKYGYNLVESEVLDNELVTTYKNKSYNLKVVTEKIEDENSYFNQAFTAYHIGIVKLNSVFDSENGIIRKYWFGTNNIREEYQLKNGEKHGVCKEYDREGRLVSIYEMENGQLNGVKKDFENDSLYLLITYSEGIPNGDYIYIIYDSANGQQKFKFEGQYINGLRTGQLLYTYVPTNQIVSIRNYKKDLLHGDFISVESDSVIVTTYEDGRRNGKFFVYKDYGAMLSGSMASLDTTLLSIFIKGEYKNGEKYGYWEYFDFHESLITTGFYENGQRTGKWKFFYPLEKDEKGKLLPYSKELRAIETYKRGKLNGESIAFSHADTIEVPCTEEITYQETLPIQYHKTKDGLKWEVFNENNPYEYMIVGSFSSAENAASLGKKMSKEGLDVIYVYHKERSFYRVAIHKNHSIVPEK